MLRIWMILWVLSLGCGDNGTAPSDGVDASDPVDAGPRPDTAADQDAMDPACSLQPGAPHLVVAFPPPVAHTDKATIAVRGTASGSQSLLALTVDGIPAESDNGFTDWRVEVLLDMGENTLAVAWTDAQAQVPCIAVELSVERVGGYLYRPTQMHVDSDANIALAVGLFHDVLTAIQLDTGAVTQVSGPEVGTGPALDEAWVVTLDTARSRALVVNRRGALEGAVIGVDLATGDRAVVSGPNVGTGIALERGGRGLAMDADSDRVFISNPYEGTVISVDLATGNRTLISTSGGARSIVLDREENRLLMVFNNGNALYALDIETGQRTLLSGGGIGNGPLMEGTAEVALDSASGRAWVLWRYGGSDFVSGVMQVDLATGDRTPISDDQTGSGIMWESPWGIGYDRVVGRLLVTDMDRELIIAVDPVSGNRSIFAGASLGSGPLFIDPFGVTVDPLGQRVLVVDREAASVVRVDLTTGDRTLVSDAMTGIGPTLSVPIDISFDPHRDRAWVITRDDSAQLFGVDLATGDRELISGGGVGSGAPFQDVHGVVWHERNPGRVLTIGESPPSKGSPGRGMIIAVELATGERTTLAQGNGIGSGQLLGSHDVAPIGDSGRALVLNIHWYNDTFPDNSVTEVDLDTGARTGVSGYGVGSGTELKGMVALAADPTEPYAYVSQRTDYAGVGGSILIIDTTTGDRTVLSDNRYGSGPRLRTPIDMALLASNAYLLIVDRGHRALYAVDVETGDRVLVSR